jgi:hypothetical protein
VDRRTYVQAVLKFGGPTGQQRGSSGQSLASCESVPRHGFKTCPIYEQKMTLMQGHELTNIYQQLVSSLSSNVNSHSDGVTKCDRLLLTHSPPSLSLLGLILQ